MSDKNPVIVLDTNILVSLFIKPAKIAVLAFQALIAGRYKIAISGEILAELTEVLSRVKIRQLTGLNRRQIKLIGSLLIEKAIKTEPKEKVDICRDPDDNKFLECALAGGADCIVSGDKDLLDLGRYGRIEIISFKKFQEILKEITCADSSNNDHFDNREVLKRLGLK